MRKRHTLISALILSVAPALAAVAYVANPPKAILDDGKAYSLVQNVDHADGSIHEYVLDSGLTFSDCITALHGKRRTACEVEG